LSDEAGDLGGAAEVVTEAQWLLLLLSKAKGRSKEAVKVHNVPLEVVAASVAASNVSSVCKRKKAYLRPLVSGNCNFVLQAQSLKFCVSCYIAGDGEKV
jgi:hypothetical protein